MRKRAANILMIVGVVFVAAALSLFAYNNYDSARAQRAADKALNSIISGLNTKKNDITDDIKIIDGEKIIDGTMTTKNIDGYDYIGYLDFPSLSVSLPVMAQLDSERLSISPCLYYGSYKTDNMIIAAHNYSSFFGCLFDLDVGDTVVFNDMEDNRIVYTVAELEQLQPADVKKMSDTDYSLTLFTCTRGALARIAVRCERAV